MNNPTFYYFRVWRGGSGKPVGQQLTIHEYLYHLREGGILHSFPGRRGIVAIIADNTEISRVEKLDFAVAFMEGRMINVSVDLNKCTSTTTNVIPPP